MNTQLELISEAKRSLNGYISSGIAGLFVKATDRLNACGINVCGWEATKGNAEHLLEHLRINGW